MLYTGHGWPCFGSYSLYLLRSFLHPCRALVKLSRPHETQGSTVICYVSQVSLSTSVRDCSLGWPPSRRTASYPQPAGTSGTQTR